ncbi:hypothetical protein M5K25_006057 [Dendrobium thyrsiflorum]|uniref:Uncharacterized protein n=1 Tax=Dendrobium thyrsiflorum TaxID=117978 RepID=A0ABD0VAI4_DENTH
MLADLDAKEQFGYVVCSSFYRFGHFSRDGVGSVLLSVIVEALKLDSLQKLCSSLEPILRRIVSEEVERALAKMAPSRLGASSDDWSV